jgi:hypothetical protein
MGFCGELPPAAGQLQNNARASLEKNTLPDIDTRNADHEKHERRALQYAGKMHVRTTRQREWMLSVRRRFGSG